MSDYHLNSFSLWTEGLELLHSIMFQGSPDLVDLAFKSTWSLKKIRKLAFFKLQ